MTLAEFRQRCRGRLLLAPVSGTGVTVRISQKDAVRLFRKTHGTVVVDDRYEGIALIRGRREFIS